MTALKTFADFIDNALDSALKVILNEHLPEGLKEIACPVRSAYLDLVFSHPTPKLGKTLLGRFDKFADALPDAAPAVRTLKTQLIELAAAAAVETAALKSAKELRATNRKANAANVTDHGVKLKSLSRAAFDTLNEGLAGVRAAYEKRALKYAGDCIEAARKSFKEVIGRVQWSRTAPWAKIVVGDVKSPSGFRVCEDRVLRFIADYKRAAHAEVDSYVIKLAGKIGKPVSSVKVRGSLWEQSFLSVVTEDGETQEWKTRCILNCSVLGKLFSQWPTRRTK